MSRFKIVCMKLGFIKLFLETNDLYYVKYYNL